jgi:hypothetical protein
MKKPDSMMPLVLPVLFTGLALSAMVLYGALSASDTGSRGTAQTIQLN